MPGRKELGRPIGIEQIDKAAGLWLATPSKFFWRHHTQRQIVHERIGRELTRVMNECAWLCE